MAEPTNEISETVNIVAVGPTGPGGPGNTLGAHVSTPHPGT
jgi:hypothetical protein